VVTFERFISGNDALSTFTSRLGELFPASAGVICDARAPTIDHGVFHGAEHLLLRIIRRHGISLRSTNVARYVRSPAAAADQLTTVIDGGGTI